MWAFGAGDGAREGGLPADAGNDVMMVGVHSAALFGKIAPKKKEDVNFALLQVACVCKNGN